ncbi:hypothetical protein BJ741DRAFT_668268 [Chytriomyces cf. hyalinus JEL632]|nr:hypothetical protein BJ741DRAFT_668258 [Chytriomyces cf. hyalinus JEL632]KAI8830753.1 hypothetical protein BJ741DRAFT_668268 [Chytriomyces cf. hyalinus JEL632]
MQYPIILSAFAVLASANNYQGQTACVMGTSCNANQQNNNLNFCCDGTMMLTCGPAGPTAHWQKSSDCKSIGHCFADANWAGCTGDSSYESYENNYNDAPPIYYEPAPAYKHSNAPPKDYGGQSACVQGSSCNANQKNNNLNFCCDGTKMLTCGPAGPTAHWQYSSDCKSVGQCFADASWAGCTGSGSDSSYYSPPAQQYNQPPPPPQQYKQSSRIRVANYGGYEEGASCVGQEGKYACGEGNNKIYVCGPAGPTAHWQYSDNCGKYGLMCSVSSAFSGCVESGKGHY